MAPKDRIMKLPTISFARKLVPAVLCLLVFVTASAAGQPTSSNSSQRPWTILVYGAVDNSADGPFIAFMNQVRRAIDDDPGIDLLVFIDRSEKHPKRSNYLGEDFTGSRLYRLR